MRVVLDTNAYSALGRGHKEVVRHVRRASEVLVSVVTLGELLYGFRLGNRFASNVDLLDRFLATPQVHLLSVTRHTADRYSHIRKDLRQAGTPIPANDMWIGAQAMESGAAILTSDRHFHAIAGLIVELFQP